MPSPPSAPAIALRDTCRKGDLAEIEFLRRATALRLIVCKPYGHGAPFDFSVHSPARVSRVQVKSTWVHGPAYYHVKVSATTRRGVRSYAATDIDLIAAYVADRDAWYIIPVAAIDGVDHISLAPHRPTSQGRYELFREAWHLLF